MHLDINCWVFGKRRKLETKHIQNKVNKVIYDMLADRIAIYSIIVKKKIAIWKTKGVLLFTLVVQAGNLDVTLWVFTVLSLWI